MWLLVLAVLTCAACAAPAPKPPPPPTPAFQPVPTAPQEQLSIQGRSQPAGPGKQAVVIFVNGEKVTEGVLTTSSPRATFRGNYGEHRIEANCKLVDRVDCEILVDGAPPDAAQPP